jgi:CBS domain containing-hemolysin-like protein
MMLLDTLVWCLFGAALLVTFLLSGMESGVFALSRLRIRQQMRAGLPSAGVLQQFLVHPENFLWTILVGNTLANLFILGTLFLFLHQTVGHLPLVFGTCFAGGVLLLYAFFDLLPKMLFRAFPNRLCVFWARPFKLVHWVLRPLVSLVESCSNLLLKLRGGTTFKGYLFGNREELRLVMQETAQGLSSEERTLINRVLDLQNLTVGNAMTPLAKTVIVSAQTPLEDVLRMAQKNKFSRIPVSDIRGGETRIVGLLSLDDLLYREQLDLKRAAGDFLRPALFLEEDLRLELALRRMQRGGNRLAIVLSRDRREIGILGLQDVLRPIFGEVTL